MTAINLRTLTDFELNKLFVNSHCPGEVMTFEPQRKSDDFLEIMDDTCYFTTRSGRSQNFNFSTDDLLRSLISSLKISILHYEENKDVTVRTAMHPLIRPVTLANSDYLKGIAFMVILIADKYNKKYVVEDV